MTDECRVPLEIHKKITEANKVAMELLNQGNLIDSGMWLSKVEAVLESNSWPEIEDRGTGSITRGYLRVLTWNNESSWWRSRGDLGKALIVLKQALEETEGVTPRQSATTCSNLCVVLSQV